MDKVKDYFNRNAEPFDKLYEKEQNLFNRLFRKDLYERVAVTVAEIEKENKPPTILDVGCGSGRNSLLFIKAGAQKVVGIDFAERMIYLARERARREGMENKCQFICGDVFTHPFDRRFDISVALGVFEYLDDPLGFLRRLQELTLGKIIISICGRSFIRMTEKKIRYYLKGCPVFFYSEKQIKEIFLKAGIERITVLKRSSAGYIVCGFSNGSV